MSIIAAILSIILGLIEVVIGLRVVAKLFNFIAQSLPGLTNAIYGWSAPFVAPFARFLPEFNIAGFIIDAPAILALVVYAVIGGLVISALRGGRRHVYA